MWLLLWLWSELATSCVVVVVVRPKHPCVVVVVVMDVVTGNLVGTCMVVVVVGKNGKLTTLEQVHVVTGVMQHKLFGW